MATETWWEAQLWNPTEFKSVEVQSATNTAVVLLDGKRRQKRTQGHVIARSRSGLKALLIAHYEREASKYEGWAQQKRQQIKLIQAVADDLPEGSQP